MTGIADVSITEIAMMPVVVQPIESHTCTVTRCSPATASEVDSLPPRERVKFDDDKPHGCRNTYGAVPPVASSV